MARDERIRVLRIIGRMNVGGPARQVWGLMQSLDGATYRQRLLFGSAGPGEAEDDGVSECSDVELRRIAGLGRSIRIKDDLRAFMSINNEVRRFRPDIIHTHTAKAGVLGRVAGILNRVPVRVHTFHGHLLYGYFGQLKSRATLAVEWVLAHGTTGIVTVGCQVGDDLLANGVGQPKQYSMVAPGIRAPNVGRREKAREEMGLEPTDVGIAFIGRLTSVKRPDRLLELARRLNASGYAVKFLVAGGGDLEAVTRQKARDLNLDMKFLGWMREPEVLYAASDIVVLTSSNEGMPVTLIEAAFFGLPAVTTDVGSAGEVVADGVSGFVTPESLDSLEAAVKELVSEPEKRRAMGARAEERAHELFTLERLARDTEELYQALLSPR